MAISYDAPTSKTDFEAGITANPSITPATQAAITARLADIPGDEIDVAAGTYDSATNSVVWQVPPGGSTDAVVVDFGGNPPPAGFVMTFPEGLTEVPVVIFDSDEGVTVTFNTIERVVQMGNGDDVVNITGDQNSSLEGGDGSDDLRTSGGNDSVNAGNGNDSIDAGAGSDSVDGGTGYDSMKVDATLDQVQVQAGKLVMAGNTVQNVEFIEFSSGETATVTDDWLVAATMRLYDTVLGRSAELAGAEWWTDEVTQTPETIWQLAATFLASPEFAADHPGGLSTEAFVDLMYQNGLGRAPEQAGTDFWVEQLDSGTLDQAQVAVFFSDSPEAQTANTNVIELDDDWV